MTMGKLRKIVTAIYVAAALCFVCSVFLAAHEMIANVLKGGLFLFVVIGFYLSFRYLRCPECGRVINLSMRTPKKCPYCKCKLSMDMKVEK